MTGCKSLPADAIVIRLMALDDRCVISLTFSVTVLVDTWLPGQKVSLYSQIHYFRFLHLCCNNNNRILGALKEARSLGATD